MKFLHTADWHLGYRQYGMAVREADFLKPLEEIAEIAIREKVDAVLVAGDMFDSIHPPASAVQAAKRFGDDLRLKGIQVLSIDGNHDLSGGKWATVCGFTAVGQVGGAIPVGNPDPGLLVSGLDFCRTQQLLERLKAMEDAKVDLKNGVLMLHLEISELTAYSTALSLRDLEPHLDALNVGYVALGHIHNAVETATDAGRIYRYPGSTEMNDTSELGLKAVDLVTVENGKYARETLNLKTRDFRVIDVDTAEAIDTKLVPMLQDPETFWLVKVNLSAPGKLINRVEDALKDRLYRIIPYGNRTIEEQTKRESVVLGLKDAIARFFPAESDEAALISQLIDTPEQVKSIAQAFVDGEDPNKKEDK